MPKNFITFSFAIISKYQSLEKFKSKFFDSWQFNLDSQLWLWFTLNQDLKQASFWNIAFYIYILSNQKFKVQEVKCKSKE